MVSREGRNFSGLGCPAENTFLAEQLASFFFFCHLGTMENVFLYWNMHPLYPKVAKDTNA